MSPRTPTTTAKAELPRPSLTLTIPASLLLLELVEEEEDESPCEKPPLLDEDDPEAVAAAELELKAPDECESAPEPTLEPPGTVFAVEVAVLEDPDDVAVLGSSMVIFAPVARKLERMVSLLPSMTVLFVPAALLYV